MKNIAALFLSATLVATPVFGASRLNEAEKRTLELSPAVVLVVVSYQVTAKFQIDGANKELDGLSFTETGTGFIYRPDGYIVTNGHVVAHANLKDVDAMADLRRNIYQSVLDERVKPAYKQITGRSPAESDDDFRDNVVRLKVFYEQQPDLKVYLANRQNYLAEIKAYSPPITWGGKDVAILKIDANNLPTVHLGDSNNVHMQEAITVMGYPGAASRLNLPILGTDSLFIPSVTNGHVSAVKVDFKGTPVIQSDAAITHGNSGGPAFTDAGDVIAIATFGKESGFNFFVPINTALEFVHQAGVAPESGLFNQLWAAALDSYDDGKCVAAKGKLQSVLNIMPNDPDALRLMTASEKCAHDEGMIGPLMENTSYLIYAGAGVVILALGLFFVMRKKSPSPVVARAGAPPVAGGVPGTRLEGGQPSVARVQSYGSLQVMAGSLSGKRFPITKAGLLVGTDPAKCQIVVSEDTVSHEHAWIVPVDNKVVVIDRGSTNGTYINSTESPRVSKVGLQNGDRVYLGKKGSVVLTYFSS